MSCAKQEVGHGKAAVQGKQGRRNVLPGKFPHAASPAHLAAQATPVQHAQSGPGSGAQLLVTPLLLHICCLGTGPCGGGGGGGGGTPRPSPAAVQRQPPCGIDTVSGRARCGWPGRPGRWWSKRAGCSRPAAGCCGPLHGLLDESNLCTRENSPPSLVARRHLIACRRPPAGARQPPTRHPCMNSSSCT